jgi:hypothetical protein
LTRAILLLPPDQQKHTVIQALHPQKGYFKPAAGAIKWIAAYKVRNSTHKTAKSGDFAKHGFITLSFDSTSNRNSG